MTPHTASVLAGEQGMFDVGPQLAPPEVYARFVAFRDDVLPELRRYGPVVQFKVRPGTQH